MSSESFLVIAQKAFLGGGACWPCPKSNLWPTLPARPVSANRRGGLQQQRKVFLGQYLDACFCCVNGDVERSNHMVAAIVHRSSNRANAVRQVFVGERPSPRSHLVQHPVALFYFRLPERCDAGSAGLCEYPFQLVWWQLGEQHFPKRCLKGRKARADGHRKGDDLGHRYSCDVDNV